MPTTIKSIILASLKYFEEHEWKSRGELFQIAQSRGYAGSQERLLQRADELAEQGVLEARQRGRMQYNWYRLAQSSPLDKDPTKRYMQKSAKILDENRRQEKSQEGLSLELNDSAQTLHSSTTPVGLARAQGRKFYETAPGTRWHR